MIPFQEWESSMTEWADLVRQTGENHSSSTMRCSHRHVRAEFILNIDGLIGRPDVICVQCGVSVVGMRVRPNRFE